MAAKEIVPPATDKRRDHEPKIQRRFRNVERELSECMKDGEVKDSQVTLLEKNKALSDMLQQRDHQFITLQNEANAIERRNRVLESKVRELESKLPHLPKSTQGRKRKDEESETVMEFKEHVKKQSMMIAYLRREQETQSSETSQDKMKIQELEDERDKLFEDFESAREAMEQLKQEKRILMDGKYVSQAEPISGDVNSCSNPRCQALQHQVYLLEEEFEESKKRVTSLEKTVARLQQEKNSAMEQCSLARVEAKIFRSDFEEERRDRTKAQGLLADFQSKKSIAANYREQETLLRQERDSAIQERNDLKRQLSKSNVELSKHAEVASLKEGFKRHLKEIEKISRQRDFYKGLYEQVKPLESEMESSKKPISGDVNSCSNPRCQALQHQVYLLQEEFEESKRRVTSLEKTVAHLQQEKNSAMEQCSLAKVEAEIFKSDFEEERRDRTKAQGLLADFQNKKSIAAMYHEQETLLRQERDGAIQERNDLKRELSKAKVELSKRTLADGLKEVLKQHISETEKMRRQRDYYRELYEKVKPLESEVEISKEVITQLRAHIESLMRKRKLKEKELKAAEEQISRGTSVNVTLTTSFEKVKDKLAIAKQDIQELKKAKKSLEYYVKKLEKTTKKTGQQRLEDVEQSSVEKLYDEELQRTMEDAFAVKQEKEILSKDLERKASRPSIGNEQPKIHNKGESSYPIRRSKHNEQGFDVMLNPNASGCRFDRSGSEYQSYPALEIGDLSEAERTGSKQLIKQSSSIHGGEDKDVRRDQSYLSLEVGDFSEAERTGLKESSSIDGGEDKDMRHVYQEQEDVKDMYKAMEDLGHEQQVKKVTDVHMPFDTNLICPLCRKQFRIGEIQKYKKHVDECA